MLNVQFSLFLHILSSIQWTRIDIFLQSDTTMRIYNDSFNQLTWLLGDNCLKQKNKIKNYIVNFRYFVVYSIVTIDMTEWHQEWKKHVFNFQLENFALNLTTFLDELYKFIKQFLQPPAFCTKSINKWNN